MTDSLTRRIAATRPLPVGDSNTRRQTFLVWFLQLVLGSAFVGAWQWGASTGRLNPLFVGEPSKIINYFWQSVFVNRDALVDLRWTMGATLIAFVAASIAAISVGLLFATYPLTERVSQPVLTGFNALPRIALAPLFLIWFGLGIWSKVALGFSLTFFIVLSSTVAGIRGVDADLITLNKTLGTKPATMFMKVTLPGAVPVIFSGLRLGLIYALLGVVSSELIAAEHGLGQRLSLLANTFQTNGVFAVLLLLAIVGGALTGLMSWLERRLLRWK